MNVKHSVRAMLVACVVSAAALVVGPTAQAAWHHGPGGGDGMELLRGVTLTDAQKTQAHEIMKAGWAAAKPLMEQMHTLREQHDTLLLTAGSTEDQIGAVIKQETALHEQMEMARLKTTLQVRALLTPDQLAQAADLHSKLEALHAQEHEAIEAAHPDAP